MIHVPLRLYYVCVFVGAPRRIIISPSAFIAGRNGAESTREIITLLVSQCNVGVFMRRRAATERLGIGVERTGRPARH